MLARGRVGACCVCAALAALIGGCTRAGSGVTVSGKTLTIYASEAPQTPSQDVVAAERLALKQLGAQVGKFTIRFVTIAGKTSDNARQAIQDKSTIAYLGEIVPHTSSASVGITNALDVLQVSPTDTALELTRSTPAVPGAPNTYYESLGTYGRTFARVVPSSALEAKALVQEMQALGVKKLYVADDGGPYGAAIALAVRQDAGSALSVVQGPPDATKFSASGADSLFIGSSSYGVAASLLRNVATSRPRAKLFAPSALATPEFVADLNQGPLNLYVSSPGFLPKDMTTDGQRFVSDFTATYHHAPATGAIFGYEAMAAVLGVLHEAGASANDRSTVVRDFFSIKNRQSVLGTYSISGGGDTTLAPFVLERFTSGKLIPYKFVQVSG